MTFSGFLFLILVFGVCAFRSQTGRYLSRQRLYYTFALNPEVDWSQPTVQATWIYHGRLVGRFLAADRPLTLAELVVLCQAYARQHGNPYTDPVEHYTLEYHLQELCEKGIVLVGEWRPFE